MTKKFSFIYLGVILLLQGCKINQKIERPLETYMPETVDELSVLNIPVNIDLRALEASLNKEFSGVVYEDTDLNDGDNMMLRAERIDSIKLGFREGFLSYRLPLGIWVKYNLGISKVEAKGSIVLDFETTYDINPDWSFQTNTVLLGHEWTESPKVKLIGIQLPVGFIADMLLDYSKGDLAAAIDAQVSTYFDLKSMMAETWNQMSEPWLVSEVYRTWLQVNPAKIALTPLQLNGDTLAGTLVVTSRPSITLGEKPMVADPSELPSFEYSGGGMEDFNLYLRTSVSYADAEQLLRDQLLGEEFSQGKRSVSVEDVELYGQNTKLIVHLTLSGAYNGSIYLEGNPYFNEKRNAIDIKNLEFTLNTRNVLFKTGAWLLKSSIKGMIQENLDFLLTYNMDDMRKQIEQQLSQYLLSDQISIEGELAAFEIAEAYLTPEQMVVLMKLSGRVKVLVKGMN